MQPSKTLRLILGDQLNSRHGWYSRPERQVVFTMMEVRQETDYVKHHIQKMSDYCNGCHYNCKEKFGGRACPFNSLYRDFLVRSRPKLKKNFRMGMIYRVWDRMPEDQQQSLLEHAGSLKADLNAL